MRIFIIYFIVGEAFGDDSYNGAFGQHVRDTKIQNIRAYVAIIKIKFLILSGFKMII